MLAGRELRAALTRHSWPERPPRGRRWNRGVVSAIVTPVAIGAAAELALRRTAPRVPTGESIGHHVAFATLMAEELPAIDISRLSGHLSASWLRLPIDELAHLAEGTRDAELDLATLAHTDSGFGLFGVSWDLVWITDHAESCDW